MFYDRSWLWEDYDWIDHNNDIACYPWGNSCDIIFIFKILFILLCTNILIFEEVSLKYTIIKNYQIDIDLCIICDSSLPFIFITSPETTPPISLGSNFFYFSLFSGVRYPN